MHALFVLFVDAADEVLALVLLFKRQLLRAQVFLLFLLLAHHLLDRLVLEFFVAFLHGDELLMLLALLLELRSFLGE